MFYSTEEAVAFGLEMDYFDRLKFTSLREVYSVQCKAALDRDQIDLASMFATQAQFCREAVRAKTIVRENPELF